MRNHTDRRTMKRLVRFGHRLQPAQSSLSHVLKLPAESRIVRPGLKTALLSRQSNVSPERKLIQRFLIRFDFGKLSILGRFERRLDLISVAMRETVPANVPIVLFGFGQLFKQRNHPTSQRRFSEHENRHDRFNDVRFNLKRFVIGAIVEHIDHQLAKQLSVTEHLQCGSRNQSQPRIPRRHRSNNPPRRTVVIQTVTRQQNQQRRIGNQDFGIKIQLLNQLIFSFVTQSNSDLQPFRRLKPIRGRTQHHPSGQNIAVNRTSVSGVKFYGFVFMA